VGIFKFKKFSVCDDGAAMKIGTDAVLLGAWTHVGEAGRILDIGTGSGVIALMMAQRSKADARIDAVELQTDDAEQASLNISNSPWPEKVKVMNTRIQDFKPGCHYDLIVCNPPFFSNSLLPPIEKRSKSRHQHSLSSEELILATVRLLSPVGTLCVILPFSESQTFEKYAADKDLFLHHRTRFFSRPGKPQERSLMRFGFQHRPPAEDSLFLYEAGDEWTKSYSALTRNFYLER
jgi:tRNA1Val (adenine37-N6)-methyltransferase